MTFLRQSQIWSLRLFTVGLKSLLQQGLSKPEFYSDLGHKLRKNVSRADFSDQFRKVIMRYKRI